MPFNLAPPPAISQRTGLVGKRPRFFRLRQGLSPLILGTTATRKVGAATFSDSAKMGEKGKMRRRKLGVLFPIPSFGLQKGIGQRLHRLYPKALFQPKQPFLIFELACLPPNVVYELALA